jgi:uncharacterized repeat protein (TIGR01451 family)
LKSGVPAVDAGTYLPNLNDGFILSGPPDMGAFEYGLPLPDYGPRVLEPDLSSSVKWADRSMADLGETVAYTVAIRNSGAPVSGTVVMTDVVPNALSYVNGSLTSTSGVVDDLSAPILRWSGDMSATSAVTLTYATTVKVDRARVVKNTVRIRPVSGDGINRSAMIIINGSAVYLPMIVNRVGD